MKFETFLYPPTENLGRATWRILRVGVPMAEKTPKTIRAWVGRDLSPDTIIDAQGWRRQCEANPGRFRLRFFS